MKCLLLAGEESGLIYARAIADVLRQRVTDVEIRGYGDFGFETGDLAVMGVGQVLCRLFFFLRVRRVMCAAIRTWHPDVVCTIDYPGMNLKLAAYAKHLGIRTVHVVCPQVWAWKRGRIPRIEASLDHLCCFFPFEPALFKPGFATFVGHPLADAFDCAAIRETPAPPPVLAVLPGSRLGEINQHLPTLLKALDILHLEYANLTAVIPAASGRGRAAIEACLARDAASRPYLRVQTGGAREALGRATCAVVASGTATLEAALARCPTVLVYRVGWLFAFLARRFITGVKHIGLANVIWEKCVGGTGEAPMPEMLQENFTVGNVVAPLRKWLDDPAARRDAVRRLDDIMRLLASDGGALARIATFLV